ncbi:DUF2188 domain-containing protein [Fictibacillus terranigra]|uniref:DUF2188 domain-containing protein n=1 Tax=Fictibacillus terranigra TaxID=3058424 RepID=A0ABT8E8W8_9BACL|nr:DUF2188 domain-containing protein [Fictibacillus sp. CENA-BCM004]MDN4074363.1 DUF2188 domain-containing protein [Fictibacillus sp. CENA-BCM004]
MAQNNNGTHNDRDSYFEDRAGTNEAHFHVVPHGEEGWAVKKEGVDEPKYTADSKTEAVKEADRLAEEAGTMAVIHNEHGRIEDQHNFE